MVYNTQAKRLYGHLLRPKAFMWKRIFLVGYHAYIWRNFVTLNCVSTRAFVSFLICNHIKYITKINIKKGGPKMAAILYCGIYWRKSLLAPPPILGIYLIRCTYIHCILPLLYVLCVYNYLFTVTQSEEW